LISVPAHAPCTIANCNNLLIDRMSKDFPNHIFVEASPAKTFRIDSLEGKMPEDFSSTDLFRHVQGGQFEYPLLDFKNVETIIENLSRTNLGLDMSDRNFLYIHLFVQAAETIKHIAIMKDYRGYMQMEYSSAAAQDKNWIDKGAYFFTPIEQQVVTPTILKRLQLNIWLPFG